MADEANYKIEILMKNLDKVSEAVQALQIDMSAAQQKFKDHSDFVLHDLDALRGRVGDMWEKDLRKQGFMEGLRTVFLRHPLVIPAIFMGLFLLVESNIVKQYFLK